MKLKVGETTKNFQLQKLEQDFGAAFVVFGLMKLDGLIKAAPAGPSKGLEATVDLTADVAPTPAKVRI